MKHTDLHAEPHVNSHAEPHAKSQAVPRAKPRVTVIIPIYNSKDYLEELHQSLLNQTFPLFQALCIDDGSSDGSAAIIDRWQEEDSRFIALHKSNGGLSSARNFGLDWLENNPNRQTDYMQFLDSDDKLSENALELLVSKADELGVDDLLFSLQAFFDSEELSQRFAVYKDSYAQTLPDGVYKGIDFVAKSELKGELLASACQHFFRLKRLLSYKIRFKNGMIHEDNLFTAVVLLKAEKIALMDKKLYLRRVREGSIMTSPLTHKRVIGYLTCAYELTSMIANDPPFETKEQQLGVEALILRYYGLAFDIYAQLDNEERSNCSFNEFPKQIALKATVQQAFERVESIQKAQHAREAMIREEERQAVVSEYESSNSYRLGRLLTSIPRKLLGRK